MFIYKRLFIKCSLRYRVTIDLYFDLRNIYRNHTFMKLYYNEIKKKKLILHWSLLISKICIKF